MTVANTPTDIWKYVNKTDSCWLWTMAVSQDGYGKWVINRKTVISHRFVWELVNGPIPVGLFVCHTCDVRNCVRPDHLFLGTHKDNMRDMREKGRAAKGDANSARKYPEKLLRGKAHHFSRIPKSGDDSVSRKYPEKLARGEANNKAKLTESQVLEIREKHAAGHVTYNDLGRKYGVNGWMISVIVRGKFWRHLIEGTAERKAHLKKISLL